MRRQIWEWMGTNAGLRVLLALAALVTMMGGWAALDGLDAEALAVSAASWDAVQLVGAVALVLVAEGALLRAVRAEEGILAARLRAREGRAIASGSASSASASSRATRRAA